MLADRTPFRAARAVVAALLLISAAACSHSPASAQDQPAAAGPSAHGGQRMRQFLESLNLTADQKSQIRSIVTDARKQNKDVTDRQTRRANMQAAYDKIDSVLTPEQKTKFDGYRAQMRNRYRGGAGAGAPSGANGN